MFDPINIWLFGGLVVLLLVVTFELGFQAARRLGNSAETTLTGVLAAALLGLLGLLLAFCFGIVEARFSTRKMLVIEEANVIGTTYLRAGMLAAPHAERSRELLRTYVDVRLRVRSVAVLEQSIGKAEALQGQLWREATAVARQDPHSLVAGLFIHSLNEVIDVHQKRVTVALHHRLPPAMLLTLCVVAALALLVHGYSAGLERGRTLLPTLTLVASLATVLLVIVELDRPWQRMFTVSQDALVSVRKSMTP